MNFFDNIMPNFIKEMVARGFWWAILAAIIFSSVFNVIGWIIGRKNNFIKSVFTIIPGVFFVFYIWHIRESIGWLIFAIFSAISSTITLVRIKLKPNSPGVMPIPKEYQEFKEKKFISIEEILEDDSISNEINQGDKYTEHVKAGFLHASQGNHFEAIKEYSAAIELDPSNIVLYERRGKAYSDIMDIENAWIDYGFCCKLMEQLINDNTQDLYTPLIPIYVNALNGMSIILIIMGRNDEAIEKLEIALKYNPNYAETYEHLGQAYVTSNEYEKAVEAYSMAININPDVENYYVSRGLSYRILGELEKAMADLTRAHELDPENEKTSEDMREIKNELLEKGIYNIVKNHLTGNINKEQTYTSKDVKNDIKNKEWESAIKKCDKLIMRNADNFEIRALRASILIDAYGDYASAISDYSMAAYYAHQKNDKQHSVYEDARKKAEEEIEKLFPKQVNRTGYFNDNSLLSGTVWMKNKTSMLEDFDFYFCFLDNENYCVSLGRGKEDIMETGTYELHGAILKTTTLDKSPVYYNFSGDNIFCGETIFRKSKGDISITLRN